MLPCFGKVGAVLAHRTTIGQLPQLQSWPRDGGAFITLPQVYTEDVRQPGLRRSNLGMYRVQLRGRRMHANEKIGLHYQIHRSIGVHHAAAIAAGKPFRVNVFVGGPPAMSLAAVMPLPEGMSELTFAGALGRRRVRMIRRPAACRFMPTPIFVLPAWSIPIGCCPRDRLATTWDTTAWPTRSPCSSRAVFHRDDAIWPFTVVGRPPQEDTCSAK